MSTAPRVQLVEAPDAPLLARPYYAIGGETSPIVRALAQVPELLPPTLAFVGQVLGPGALDLRTKELIILRVSALAECAYCIGAHRLGAADAGVEERESAALLGLVPLAEAFPPHEVELLELCDAIAAGGEVPDARVSPVLRRLGGHGLVEVTMVAATTLMLNRLCTTLRLPLTAAARERLAALDGGVRA